MVAADRSPFSTGVALSALQRHLQLQLLPGPRWPLRHRSAGLPGQVSRLRQRARLPKQVRAAQTPMRPTGNRVCDLVIYAPFIHYCSLKKELEESSK